MEKIKEQVLTLKRQIQQLNEKNEKNIEVIGSKNVELSHLQSLLSESKKRGQLKISHQMQIHCES